MAFLCPRKRYFFRPPKAMVASGRERVTAPFDAFWLLHLGPLQAADLLGIDQVVATARVLCTVTGDSRFAPHPLLLSLEERGYLGWKNGRGFYDYALDD